MLVLEIQDFLKLGEQLFENMFVRLKKIPESNNDDEMLQQILTGTNAKTRNLVSKLSLHISTNLS